MFACSDNDDLLCGISHMVSQRSWTVRFVLLKGVVHSSVLLAMSRLMYHKHIVVGWLFLVYISNFVTATFDSLSIST